MTDHTARIFAEGSYVSGTLTWGWQCTCGDEEHGYGTATGAQSAADGHEAMP